MEQITREEFNSYKVVCMNKNSLTLVKADDERVRVLVTKRVFNTIMSNKECPIFILERDHNGCKYNWFATPFSI